MTGEVDSASTLEADVLEPVRQAAAELASTHSIAPGPGQAPDSLRCLQQASEFLEGCRAALSREVSQVADPTAVEWFLDNHHAVQIAMRVVAKDMPAGFLARLPGLASGPFERLPRIYALAHHVLSCCGGQFGQASIVEFVHTYQETSPLTIAELWALPVMLRLGCIEHIAEDLSHIVTEIECPLPAGTRAGMPRRAGDVEDLIQAIRQLHTIDNIQWETFFHQTSLVERVLSRDPAGVYARMDFETCDHYRDVVERLAEGTGHTELEVAEAAVGKANAALRSSSSYTHVGFYLTGSQSHGFERELGYRPYASLRLRRLVTEHATAFYLGGMVAATLFFMLLPVGLLLAVDASVVALIVGTLVSLVPASALAAMLVNFIVTSTVPPRTLPKMDFSEGIPQEHRTAVVVPTLLGNKREVDSLIQQLEIHYLANPLEGLEFALLTDPLDSPSEIQDEDEELIAMARAGVERLNAKHGARIREPFHLLHRKRRFNPRESCWMSWERKRGKLEEFNRLLGGADDTSYVVQVGNQKSLRGVRYVITLDTDTALPRGTAARLVGIMAHPLNRPVFDEDTGRVKEGYTIVQPRVEISPSSGRMSAFSSIFASDAGIDLYSRAVSDVYQDLFDAGIYVGKGIYDVRAFERSLANRAPENALASHDLFEGIHGRVALASDVVLFEDFPPHFLAYIGRMHRWVRGDWQLLPWLRARVPTADGAGAANRLLAIDRWKVFDNLRRSLFAPTLMLFLVTAWLVLPGSPLLWTLVAILTPAGHAITSLVHNLARGSAWSMKTALRAWTSGRAAEQTSRYLLTLVFLPYEAWVVGDAIVRVLYRLVVSRRHLLQWRSAAHTSQSLTGRGRHALVWREMFPAPLLALALAASVTLLRPEALLAAAPLLLAWLVSPEIARRISQLRQPEKRGIEPGQQRELRLLARRTWLFFETFVGPDDNWLPPDNFQEDPGGELAHRTSPTNIGMMLLSALSAHDLGYLGLRDLVIRLRHALKAIGQMEHYRGHLLNWYDTRTLEPLLPRYVSTVDSGNLLAALILLRQSCAELRSASPVAASRWNGLVDSLRLLGEVLAHACRHAGNAQVCYTGGGIDHIVARIEKVAVNETEWPGLLAELEEQTFPRLAHDLKEILQDPDADIDRDDLHNLRTWLARVQHDIGSMRRDLEHFAPWATLPLCELPAACEPSHRCRERAEELLDELSHLDSLLTAEIHGMSFRLLYDQHSHLFHIGHNVTANRIDPNHYDLLASESRVASLLAIARGDVPLKHWSFLRRPFTRTNGHLTLLSWGGTMFEYLMPNLFLKAEGNSLLAQSCEGAVASHIAWGKRRDTPWGISESAYASLSADQVYHYKAFGVPGLGIKRGLADDLVVAPYASVLAVSTNPAAVMDNLEHMRADGLLGTYGFFEAGDYTPSRLARSQRVKVVRCYMAHHQGMILVALNNCLSGEPMSRRLKADPMVQTAMILLEEGSPGNPPVEMEHPDDTMPPAETEAGEAPDTTEPQEHRRQLPAWIPEAGDPCPQVHLLSNGRLTSMVTDSGAGYIGWRQQRLTRWRPDTTLDNHGLWVYVRDEETHDLWSVSSNPTKGTGAHRVLFHPHMVEFAARANGVFARMEVAVPPAHDMEIRTIVLTNETDRERTLSVTTHGEVVLAHWMEHERHPAFSKLFVQTSYHKQLEGLLHERCPRSPEEPSLFLLHRLCHDGNATLQAAYTERSDFLGRWGDPLRPAALEPGAEPAWPQDGATLDPIVGLQARVSLPPHGTVSLAFVTIAGSSREQVLQTARNNASLAGLQWLVTDAHHTAATQLQTLSLAAEALPEVQRLLSMLLYPTDAKVYQDTGAGTRPSRQALWATGISGDRPILALRVHDNNCEALLELLLAAHRYWRSLGAETDLAILREGATSYEDSGLAKLRDLIVGATDPALMNREGGVFLIQGDQVRSESRDALLRTAAVVLDSGDGSIADQLRSLPSPKAELPPLPAATQTRNQATPQLPLPRPDDLQFDNGLGGFAADGKEYVIHLLPGQHTPAPWCNVLANRRFGCLVSEAGLGHTWTENSSENRLTPWSNDPVRDLPAEIVYLRDEESAQVWTPTPMPAGQDHACRIHHGLGYTEYHRESHQLYQRLTVFVPQADPVKVLAVRLTNRADHPRRLTCTYYLEWVLGSIREPELPHIAAEYATDDDAVLVHNPFHRDCPDQVAFVASDLRTHGVTVDRREFLGQNGHHQLPAAMARWGLSGETSTHRDPCTALQVHIDLGSKDSVEFHFFLGAGRDRQEARKLISHYRGDGVVATELSTVQSHWRDLLEKVQVKTPDPAMDVMLNGWLLYQSVASRQLARTGFYQSSGAFGFRDQLQDVLPLAIVDPAATREHILETARHQFQSGDAVHWWHPPGDHGLRTRCSDDMLWLPYCTSEYIRTTGDTSILEESVTFLHGDPLTPEERDRYAKFQRTQETWTILEHCRRAAEHALTTGPRGLPLIQDGDWNDGMNRVGSGQHGESVWLGWFGHAVATRMAELSDRVGDPGQAQLWRQHASQLASAVETAGWDGAWYRRAFYDSGIPIGSTTSDECRIDSIAQSWAVLSGGGKRQRASQALASAKRLLLRPDQKLALLLWPPFTGRMHDPGYIASYPPGIRENGGQYSHAAAWLGCALAEIGDGEGAKNVFDCVNPIRRADTTEEMLRYRVEPYVVAGDIYSVAPHAGRGGWTWYTGAAAWTWRLGIEWILGLRLQDGRLHIDPHIPADWPAYEATIKIGDGNYHVQVLNPDRVGNDVAKVLLNGSPWSEDLPLPEPGQTHELEVHLGKANATRSTS